MSRQNVLHLFHHGKSSEICLISSHKGQSGGYQIDVENAIRALKESFFDFLISFG